jgi:hypothetical protein
MAESARPTKMRCCALDARGFRCHRKAIGLFMYHGDNEIYDYPCGAVWVAVPFCGNHAKETKSDRYNERKMRILREGGHS